MDNERSKLADKIDALIAESELNNAEVVGVLETVKYSFLKGMFAVVEEEE